MRTKTLLFAIMLCGICFASNGMPGKNTPAPVFVKYNGFGAFHAHRQQDGIALAWTYSSGSATGFIIQHSFDGVNFVTIDEVAPDFKGWDNYNDNAALPGFNYYKIGARLSDGSIDYSDVEMVRIVKRK